VKTILRFLFKLLYHQFAFAYDLIAAIVSVGRWQDWITSVLPFMQGTRLLEIGFGPGHLQCLLLDRNLISVGIDESPQMARQAQRSLKRVSFPDGLSTRSALQPHQSGYAQINLARGLAQHLPFRDAAFDTVVATFPAEYIFDPDTLTEAYRVLTATGRFVVLPGAVIVGRRIIDRLMAGLFRFTGQTPPNLSEIIHERSKKPFAEAGFQVKTYELEVKLSIVFIMVATKFATHPEEQNVQILS